MGSANSRASGILVRWKRPGYRRRGQERDGCGALGAARQSFRNGPIAPRRDTADFVAAPAVNSSTSAARRWCTPPGKPWMGRMLTHF